MIASGDVLRLRVWPEEALSGEYPVEVSGIVYLRLLGELHVAGIKADGRTRTDDLLITNQLLYQLSYASECWWSERR